MVAPLTPLLPSMKSAASSLASGPPSLASVARLLYSRIAPTTQPLRLPPPNRKRGGLRRGRETRKTRSESVGGKEDEDEEEGQWRLNPLYVQGHMMGIARYVCRQNKNEEKKGQLIPDHLLSIHLLILPSLFLPSLSPPTVTLWDLNSRPWPPSFPISPPTPSHLLPSSSFSSPTSCL